MMRRREFMAVSWRGCVVAARGARAAARQAADCRPSALVGQNELIA